MLNKLRIKLTLICLGVTTSVLIIMIFSSLIVSQKQLNDRIKLSLDVQMNTLIYYLQSSSFINWNWLSELEASNEMIVYIEDNHIPLLFKGSYHTTLERASLISLAKAEAQQKYKFNFYSYKTFDGAIRSTQFELKTRNNENFLVSVASIGSTQRNFQLILLKDLKLENLGKLRLLIFFIFLALICLILLSFFSFWFSKRAIKPIEESIHNQKDFIAAASHELRSPLTVIQTSASALMEQKGEAQIRFITFILDECKRMSRLISDLLLLSYADANTNWSLCPQTSEADTLLVEIYDQFYPIAQENAHQLVLQLPEEAISPCLLDRERLRQVVVILLENALSYTPSGCTITLSLLQKGHALYIKVIDNGTGIPDEKKKHIFDRFYRGDSSRHHRDHYGLGLSIAYEIIKLMNGKLSLSDTPGGGCTFTITLPIKAK